MFQVQVTGLKETEKYLANLTRSIRPIIVTSLGDAQLRIMNILRNDFPDLTFTSQLYPEQMELWIFTEGIVICKATGKRMAVKTEREVGRERGAGTTPFRKDFILEELSEKLGRDTAMLIRERINEVLKWNLN